MFSLGLDLVPAPAVGPRDGEGGVEGGSWWLLAVRVETAEAASELSDIRDSKSQWLIDLSGDSGPANWQLEPANALNTFCSLPYMPHTWSMACTF